MIRARAICYVQISISSGDDFLIVLQYHSRFIYRTSNNYGIHII